MRASMQCACVDECSTVITQSYLRELIAGNSGRHKVSHRECKGTVGNIAALVLRFVLHGVVAQRHALGVAEHGERVRVPPVVAWEIFQVARHGERDDVAIVRVRTRYFCLQLNDVRATFRNNHAWQGSRSTASKRIG